LKINKLKNEIHKLPGKSKRRRYLWTGVVDHFLSFLPGDADLGGKDKEEGL
jgi:hypothetical protein